MPQTDLQKEEVPEPAFSFEGRFRLLFIFQAVLLAQMQKEATNGPDTVADDFHLTLAHYMDVGSGIPFYRSRLLMRWIIDLVSSLSGWSYEFSNEVLQTVFLSAAFLICFQVARYFLDSVASAAVVFFVGAWIPWSFTSLGGPISFAYDFPALFFSLLGIYLILRDQRWLLLVVFLFGTLNKETTFWLLGAFFFCRVGWKPSLRDVGWLAVYTAIFIAGYIVPRLYFGHNNEAPTSTLMFFWEENFLELTLFLRGSLFQNAHMALAPHAIALLGWRSFPTELKQLYMAALLCFFPAMFLVGNFAEVRIFQEVLPLAMIGIMASIRFRNTPAP